MKNEQKYNTADERVKAFVAYCKNKKACDHDSVQQDCPKMKCMMEWLALEADDEKPEPCPFCGGMCVAYDKVVVCQNVKCDYRSGSYDNRYAAIAAHNRVVRAVRAAGEDNKKGVAK